MGTSHKSKRGRDAQIEFPVINRVTFASKAAFAILCLMPIYATIAFGAVDSWAISHLSILMILFFGLWAADSILMGEFRVNVSKLVYPMLGLLLVGLIQLLPFGAATGTEMLTIPAVNSLSLDPYATRLFIVRLLFYIGFFIGALTYLDSRRRVRNVVIMIVIFGALLALFGIMQQVMGAEAIYGLRATPQAIFFGPFVNQHHFAAFMEMTVGLTFGLIFGNSSDRNTKLLLGIAAGLMLIAIGMTGSRGAFLGIIGVGAVVLLFKRNSPDSRVSYKVIFAGMAIFSLLAVLGIVFLGGGESLLRGLGLRGGVGDVSSGRFHFWGVATDIFTAHPIIGGGFDSFAVAFSKYDTWNGMFRIERAHNDYLQILADGGILGFACVVSFIYFMIRQSKTFIGGCTDKFFRSSAVGALAGCVGILIHSVFDFPLRTQSNVFFFLLLVILATGGFCSRVRAD